MAKLAGRLACKFGGGGGTTTTNASIPEEFMPYLTPLIQDSAGRMRGLQDYFWGEGGAGQGYQGGGGGGWGYEDAYPGIPDQDVYPGGVDPNGGGGYGTAPPGDDPYNNPPGGKPGGDIGNPGPGTDVPYTPPPNDDGSPGGTGGGGNTPGGTDVPTPPPGDSGGDGKPAPPGGSDPTNGLPVPPWSMPDEAIQQWWVDQGYLNPDGSPGPNHPNTPATGGQDTGVQSKEPPDAGGQSKELNQAFAPPTNDDGSIARSTGAVQGAEAITPGGTPNDLTMQSNPSMPMTKPTQIPTQFQGQNTGGEGLPVSRTAFDGTATADRAPKTDAGTQFDPSSIPPEFQMLGGETKGKTPYNNDGSQGDGGGGGGGGGGTGGGGGSTDPYTPSGIGIHEDNTRDVAGASINQRRAGQMAGEIAAPSAGEGAAWGALGNLFGQSGQMATGHGMASDPATQATYNTFMKFGSPMISDQYSSMGLGRSTDKGEALGMGLADMMMPAMQGYLDRQTGMIDRDVGIAQSGIQGGLSLAGQELNRQGTAFDAYSQSGDVQRGIEQEQRDAPWEDFMRRAALGESALMGPFGGLVPSSIGSQVTSSGGK
jgi:hypothetical protein